MSQDLPTLTAEQQAVMGSGIANLVKSSCTRLEAWVEHNGWEGFDPYDIRGTRWYLKLTRWQALPLRVLRKFPFSLINRYPVAVRKLAHVKAINAKGMGLLTTSYCRLFEATRNEIYLARARECADWLLAHPSQGYPGLSWGYPFDWQSVVFIPKGTPSVVVSSVVGDGLWHLLRLTEEKKYWDACLAICDFILHGLNQTEIDNQALCFSYTPIDNFLVHNANLFGAEFLSRLGKHEGRDEWLQTAIRAGNYFLAEQNQDGSVYYWGRLQNQNAPNHRDCYHSGFEIRSLWGLWKATGDTRFQNAALRYFDFFERAYLRDDGAVMNSGSVYPLDIHACAEALLCPAIMSEALPDRCVKVISRSLPWIVSLMQNADGSFAYMAFENGRIDRTPFLRWGQAWMLRALAELRVLFKGINESEF